MNKKDFIRSISEKTGYTQKDVTETIEAMISVIAEAAKNGNDINIVGFGKFQTKVRPAGTARNPRTGETINTPETRLIKFKPSTVLKDAIN